MNRIVVLFKKLPLQIKLILIGLVPAIFFLYISVQYYKAEKQTLQLLHNNIRIIHRSGKVNKLIDQLRVENRLGYEYTLRKDQNTKFIEQWKHTDSALEELKNIVPELKDMTQYTMLDSLENVRRNIIRQKMTADDVMIYYTVSIFRTSYLDVHPELLLGSASRINQDIRSLRTFAKMTIYMPIIYTNIYNTLYMNTKYAPGTLYILNGLYQLYNAFEKEFLIKATPGLAREYLAIKDGASLKPVIAYLDASFKRMKIDNTYTAEQWWKLTGDAMNDLKVFQDKLAAQINHGLVSMEAAEEAKLDRLLILLLITMAAIITIVGYTILDIRARLTELKHAAEKIAVGDTGLALGTYSDDVIGELAGSVAKIDENNRMLAVAANAIGRGDFAVEVHPRGERDVLGNAIWQMKNELARFTTESKAHAVELERLLAVVKQSETHFRRLADQAPQMIWQVDKNNDTIYVNRQWLDFTGLSREESMGKKWMQVLHPDDLTNGVYRPFAEAFANRTTYKIKARLRNANNEYRWMYVQGNPIFNVEFDGFIGTLTDITDQIEAEEAIRDLMHKKDEFLSIASHELRTPLTSIKAYSQLVVRNSNPEKSNYFLNKTLYHVSRLEKLINDLLEISRIDSGRVDYNLELVQFSELFNNSIEVFADISNKHRIVVKNVAQGMLKVDRLRVEQVFNNLLDNAAKYSPNADIIEVDSRIEDGFIVVSVKDYGVGISKKDCEQLFERFYRSEETSIKFQGLGLGLFISSEIVRRHNGQMWVVSEPSQGSTFYFKLPLYKEVFGKIRQMTG